MKRVMVLVIALILIGNSVMTIIVKLNLTTDINGKYYGLMILEDSMQQDLLIFYGSSSDPSSPSVFIYFLERTTFIPINAKNITITIAIILIPILLLTIFLTRRGGKSNDLAKGVEP